MRGDELRREKEHSKVFSLYTPHSGFAPRKRSKNAREGAGWKVGTMWPARRIVAKLKSCAPEGKRKRGSAGLESSHGHAQCAWLASARGTRVAVRGWCARSAHLVWRAGDGVRGDVACRRLARLGLEIPAVRGAARGPWPRGVWGGEGGAAGAWAQRGRHAPLTSHYGPLTASYWLLATRGSPGSPRRRRLLLLPLPLLTRVATPPSLRARRWSRARRSTPRCRCTARTRPRRLPHEHHALHQGRAAWEAVHIT